MKKFTCEDIINCWDYWLEYFVEILNNEYDLKDAQNDLESLIDSKHDKRIINQSIDADQKASR